MTPALFLRPAIIIGVFAMLLGTTWLERLIERRPIGTVAAEHDQPRPRCLADDFAAPSH